MDLLHSPVKDILRKLAEDTFSPDNRNDEEKSLKRGLSASADTPCVSAYAQSAYGTPAPRYVPMAHTRGRTYYYRIGGIMHNLEDRLEKHAKDINAIVDNYWNEYDEYDGLATPSQDFIDKIESLISEYGFHKVANAFNINTKAYCFTFDEYTTDAESFELDEDVLGDEEDELYIYKAYCRWRPYWPLLISEKSMNMLKEYENRIRKCHGKFFTLTKQVLNLPTAILNELGEWEKDWFDWNDDDCQYMIEMSETIWNNDYCQYMIETSEFTMTDAELEQCHAKYQSNRIKAIVLELINRSAELPLDAIKAYTLCKTRSVTPEGWGPDIYVLSESDRSEIIQALSNRVGCEMVADLFDKDSDMNFYYLRGTYLREDAFGICFDKGDNIETLYRPKVDIEKYLLSAFPVDRFE